MEEGRIIIEQLIMRAIKENIALEIDYYKNSFDRALRIISDISISEEFGFGYISAYCHLRKAQRTFKISNIIGARIVDNPDDVIVEPTVNYEFNPRKPIFNLYGEEY